MTVGPSLTLGRLTLGVPAPSRAIPAIPSLALRFSDGTPLQFSDGKILEWSK